MSVLEQYRTMAYGFAVAIAIGVILYTVAQPPL
jgi:hypothetical protein